MSAEAYTLAGPAFAHVKSALMLARMNARLVAELNEYDAALSSLDTAVRSPVEEGYGKSNG